MACIPKRAQNSLYLVLPILFLISMGVYYGYLVQTSEGFVAVNNFNSQTEQTQTDALVAMVASGKSLADKAERLATLKELEQYQSEPESNEERQHSRFLLVRWATNLGFNNVRYEIEHHLLYANLTNRTLVIPTNIHMRSCLKESLCMKSGFQYDDEPADPRGVVNKWATSIQNFIDLPQLKNHAQVLTMQEFLRLMLKRSPNPDQCVQLKKILISRDDIETFTFKPQLLGTVLPSMYRWSAINFQQFLHDRRSSMTLLVDSTAPIKSIFQKLRSASQGKTFPAVLDLTLYGYADQEALSLDVAFNATYPIMSPELWEYRGNIPWEDEPEDVGPEPARRMRKYTRKMYKWPAGMSEFRDHVDADKEILLNSGDAHRMGRQPMLFSANAGRINYENLALIALRYSPEVFDAARYAAGKLDARTGGRPYIAMHLRRADFEGFGWEGVLSEPKLLIWAVKRGIVVAKKIWESPDIAERAERALRKWPDEVSWRVENEKEENGREEMKEEKENEEYEVNKDLWDMEVDEAEKRSSDEKATTDSIPLPRNETSEKKSLSTLWYLATDESNPKTISELRNLNAITISSLLANDDEFNDRFGHLAAFGDWLGLVDQLLCMRAFFFIGTQKSAFSGGVHNFRRLMRIGSEMGMSADIEDFIVRDKNDNVAKSEKWEICAREGCW